MRASAYALAAVASVVAMACQKPAPQAAAAPTAAAQNPVSDAFRMAEAREARNLVAAIDDFPANKFAYKPTKAQMTVGEVAVHLSEGNDMFCSALSGDSAPQRSKIAPTAPKADLSARLKDTFAFCDSAVTKITDASLADSVPSFGGRKATRAALLLITAGDWSDHYSQLANYLRLNGILPPTARGHRGM